MRIGPPVRSAARTGVPVLSAFWQEPTQRLADSANALIRRTLSAYDVLTAHRTAATGGEAAT
jgi:hypothetical protein